MTKSTGNVFVRSCQVIVGPGIVIKCRRFPFKDTVATRTFRRAPALFELSGVDIVMAPGADSRRRFERHILHTGFEITPPVAGVARHGPVRTLQRKISRVVIEALDPFPVTGCVACFTALEGPVRLHGRHALRELTPVRIFMTLGATVQLESIFHGGRRDDVRPALVAIDAQHSPMGPGEREAALHVACQGKSGRLESLHVVAGLAPVVLWRVRKLAFVDIRVAYDAGIALEHEDGVGTVRHVALAANDCRMLVFQRKLGRLMYGDGESGRLETSDLMTTRAFSLVGACRKLTLVIVLSVTIHALRVCHRSLEIVVCVAFLAGDGHMLSFQRI